MASRRYPSRITRKPPSKRNAAITFIANCPPERRASLTAADVARNTGLRLGECERLLGEFEARVRANG